MKPTELQKLIRKREDQLYKSIEERNRLEARNRALRFENSTLVSHIQTLKEKIDDLQQQLAELRRQLRER
jgi:peptidoglycan hydrolase CwlO-like protein